MLFIKSERRIITENNRKTTQAKLFGNFAATLEVCRCYRLVCSASRRDKNHLVKSEIQSSGDVNVKHANYSSLQMAD